MHRTTPQFWDRFYALPNPLTLLRAMPLIPIVVARMEPLGERKSGRTWDKPGFRRKRLHPGYSFRVCATSVINLTILADVKIW